MIEHRLQTDVVIAELIKVFADPLLDRRDLEILLLEGLRQLHLASHFVVFNHLANSLQVLGHFIFDHLSILLLALCQMGHNLSQLHFSKLIQFFGFEHSLLDLANSLWKDLNLLVGQILHLYAVGAEHLAGKFVP